MRILLDESVPERLGPLLVGHAWDSVRKNSNRVEDLARLVPAVLRILNHLKPCTVHEVSA